MKDITLTVEQGTELKKIGYDMSDSNLSIALLKIGDRILSMNNSSFEYSYPLYTFSEIIEDFPDIIIKDDIVYHFDLTKKNDKEYRILYYHNTDTLFCSVHENLMDCAYDTIVWLICNDYIDIKKRNERFQKKEDWYPKSNERCWYVYSEGIYFTYSSEEFNRIRNGNELYKLGRIFPYNKEDEAKSICNRFNKALKSVK